MHVFLFILSEFLILVRSFYEYFLFFDIYTIIVYNTLITVKIGSRIEFLTIAKAIKEERKF